MPIIMTPTTTLRLRMVAIQGSLTTRYGSVPLTVCHHRGGGENPKMEGERPRPKRSGFSRPSALSQSDRNASPYWERKIFPHRGNLVSSHAPTGGRGEKNCDNEYMTMERMIMMTIDDDYA